MDQKASSVCLCPRHIEKLLGEVRHIRQAVTKPVDQPKKHGYWIRIRASAAVAFWFTTSATVGFLLAIVLFQTPQPLAEWVVGMANGALQIFGLTKISVPNLEDSYEFYAGVGTFGVAVVSATIKSCVDAVAKVLEKFPTIDDGSLYSMWLKVFGAVFGLGLTLLAVPKAISHGSVPEKSASTLTAEGDVTEKRPAAATFDVSFVQNAHHGTLLTDSDEAIYNESFVGQLRSLGQTLLRCVSPEVGQAKVHIAVYGFASESEWNDSIKGLRKAAEADPMHADKYLRAATEIETLVRQGRAQNDAEAFNLLIAKRRALFLVNRMFELKPEQAPPAGIQIDDMTDHFTFRQLYKYWPLIDMEQKDLKDESGVLTRTARVEIISAGKCSRPTKA